MRKDLTAITEGVEGQIFMYFDKIKILNASWSSDGKVNALVPKILENNDGSLVNEVSDHLIKNKLPLEKSVIMIDLLDLDFNIMASSDKNRIGISEKEHIDEFGSEKLEKVRYGEALIGHIIIEDDEPFHPTFPVLHSISPILDEARVNIVGFMMVHVEAEELNKITQGAWQEERGALSGQKFIVNQETAEMYLVNKDGYMITPSRFVENSIFNQKIDNPATRKCFDEKEEFAGGYIDYLGHPAQGASMCFVDYDFALLAEINDGEVFASLIKERDNVVLVGLLVWLVSLAIIVLVSFRFLLRHLKAITSAANEVSKNNFDIKVRIDSKDELGVLANAFNIMIGNIKESREGLEEVNKKLEAAYEDLEKSAISLEGKVKARTKELEDIKATLELRVHEKTMELQKRLDELEKFRKLTLGRELRMIELKEEIVMLKSQIKDKEK